MGGRRDRERGRARARAGRRMYGVRHGCPQCGALDAHFVPPGMMEPGFYVCDVDARFRGKMIKDVCAVGVPNPLPPALERVR